MADKPTYQEILIKIIKCLEAGKVISNVYKMPKVLLMIYSHRYINCDEKANRGGVSVMGGYIALVPVVLLSSEAYSQQPKNASYSCVVEWVGGGWYNPSTKRWEGNAFKPSSLGDYSKFALAMQFVERRPVLTFKKTENLDDYKVFITPSGSPFPRDCDGNNDSGNVTMRLGTIRCSAAAGDYIFDQNTNRFLQVSAVGYFTGRDCNDELPFVAGGTCTKVE